MRSPADGKIRIMRIIARMNVGGPARQVSGLSRHLDPARFEQRLYTGHVAAGEADHLALSAPDIKTWVVRGLGRSVRPLDDLAALAQLHTEMRRFRPHIVHTHTAKAGALGRTAAMLARVPAVVHTYHGHLLHGSFSARTTRLVVGVEKILARSADRLLTVGARVRDDLIAAGIGRPGQYIVMPPGTSVGPPPAVAEARRMLGLPADALVVSYVGRVTAIKRPDRLLAVFRSVLAARPRTRFVVCGEGDMLNVVRAAEAEFAGALSLVGWRSDVETVYAASDVTLLASDSEGMPLSLIEAGMVGIPAVATRVGSVAEVVNDGSTGLLSGTDADELAGHVLRLLDDGELRRTMGEAAREWVTHRFGVPRLVADTEAVYTEIARAHGW
ncbi:glycosyltransferase [Nonomuraea sediminis]|uniref:glycosyltransferase n=1 Tax=Nonomuraea sediminis TaxID=2835864 RepID=UPI001BDCF440|nr:glycosyltransferase [Nonomuraea sediminis]